ncbi:uncharacterized protein LOC115033193 [Acyrthosiphon pisum]|uniref:Uncharacterized protein n=1 Tax=Acyrthosiphon pisum TaxID=7029 RepID=A0A8R2JLD6_ACYPI|nr:uncharacterized protein LOC115033193 [Acyrthosiphon pisum]
MAFTPLTSKQVLEFLPLNTWTEEYDENSRNCLENVKLKDIENGSYINSNYLMKCTSTETEEFNEKPQNITENETVLTDTSLQKGISNIELMIDTYHENVKLKEMENGCYMNSNYLMKCTSTQTGNSI